jgi:hypothetical protein
MTCKILRMMKTYRGEIHNIPSQLGELPHKLLRMIENSLNDKHEAERLKF